MLTQETLEINRARKGKVIPLQARFDPDVG